MTVEDLKRIEKKLDRVMELLEEIVGELDAARAARSFEGGGNGNGPP